jgi:dihydroneopterin aldolase
MAEYDQILLEGMIFHSHIGVHAFEKEQGQDIIVDVTLTCKPLPAGKSDDLHQTIDYGQVFALVRDRVEQASCDLLEHLADILASQILDTFASAERAEVTLRKPHAPISGRFQSVGVRVVRERPCGT